VETEALAEVAQVISGWRRARHSNRSGMKGSAAQSSRR